MEPGGYTLIDFEDRRYSSEELDDLFAETPDEQLGSVDELGWYGLVKHQGQAGGGSSLPRTSKASGTSERRILTKR